MNRIKSLKYLSVLSLPVLAYISFTSHGIYTYLPVIEGFVLIPLLELFFRPDSTNLEETEEEIRKDDRLYDLLIYLVVPVQLIAVWLFLNAVSEPGLATVDVVGRIAAMGMLCGVMGINVAHELGHRSTWHEQLMSKALLMTSLYMHFFIEHNRGHHKHVSTPEDPSTARKGELVYTFWFRSIIFSYLSAWKLERERLKKKEQAFISIHNEMLRFQLIQLGLLTAIWFYFGPTVMLYFLASAFTGMLLLETVQYIEHYGLSREKKGDRYERVMPHHSWNSNHTVGRIMLFELSRHSDHHFIASRKYQILRHIDESPQMPTGYPGMMLMAMVPPLWFRVMNPRIKD